MFGVAISDDYQPVAWMGRYPIHVTTLLVMVHVVCMIICSLLIAFGAGAFLNLLVFDSAQVLSAGRLWQVVTYAFVHSPSGLIWFAIEMYMLFAFGREVERFIGRRAFITLYLLLLSVPPILLTIWGLWHRTGLAGSATIHFAIFIAFAAIYPNVELFLRIMAKWIALVFVAAYSLQLLAFHAWSELAVLWMSVGLAYGFIQLRGAGPELAWLTDWTSRWRSKRSLTVVPRSAPRRVVEPEDIYESIDPVLDKISKSGIGSLTAGERRALDRARNRLLKKPE
ncbi:MAG: rhomboid family intramembrane serine protease [Verrucomicrobiota bacterium]|nr:rhomboid family intramembrane serine protease [Chthoniobacterales bacterium]MDQ3117668.1 rhomboid family intramembrane serine protease [Verrucomicrobiota bacterium]MDQ3545765.1 rhomboid family intramembrane serine protease [Verrucomicrobiota bacterium]